MLRTSHTGATRTRHPRPPCTLGRPALALLVLGVASAQAEDFTLGPNTTAAELQAILTLTATNRENDSVDLGGRTFVLDAPLLIVPEVDRRVTVRNGVLERAPNTPAHRLVEVRRPPGSSAASPVDTVNFRNMTFRDGLVIADEDDPTRLAGGGAMFSDWPTNVSASVFEGNRVVPGARDGYGGAVFTVSEMRISDSVLKDNAVVAGEDVGIGRGGAVASEPNFELGYSNVTRPSISIDESDLVGNRADLGGALYASVISDENGFDDIEQSVLRDNSSTGAGGAVWLATSPSSWFQVENSTFANNTAGTSGGAMHFEPFPQADGRGFASFDVVFSAFVGNTAEGGSGGALYAPFTLYGERFRLRSSILGDNVGGNCGSSDGGGVPSDEGETGANIADDASCGRSGVTVVEDIDTLFLGGLAPDGGNGLPVFALAPGSIAVDAGLCGDDDAVVGGIELEDLEEDQRDRPRPLRIEDGVDVDADEDASADAGSDCDIGPYELQGLDDADDDGAVNNADNCPVAANPDQRDADGDGAGDACDTTPNGDSDGDGIDEAADNCPAVANPDQRDADGDGAGDACDATPNGDSDGDGIDEAADNCPAVANPDQRDADGDGTGDVCDTTTGEDDPRPAVNDAVSELESITAGTRGRVNRILSRAERFLDRALRDANWTSESELSERRGTIVFRNLSAAVNEIERVADNRGIDAALRASLDEVSEVLLDTARRLAVDEIAAAEAANGTARRIDFAERWRAAGDRNRGIDSLRAAVRSYGYAWRWAGAAY